MECLCTVVETFFDDTKQVGMLPGWVVHARVLVHMYFWKSALMMLIMLGVVAVHMEHIRLPLLNTPPRLYIIILIYCHAFLEKFLCWGLLLYTCI